MRLKPPACEGLVRETPPEGLTVDGVFIPGKTIVSVPTWTIQRDPRYWEDPEEWRPERWEGVNPNEEGLAFLPFSKGELCFLSPFSTPLPHAFFFFFWPCEETGKSGVEHRLTFRRYFLLPW